VVIALPGPDQLPPGPQRQFFEALHGLYDTAGQPGARVISKEIRRNIDLPETVSHETVSAVLRGATVPAWAKVHSIIVALAGLSTRDHNVRELSESLQQLWLVARSQSRTPDVGEESYPPNDRRDPTGVLSPPPPAPPHPSAIQPLQPTHPIRLGIVGPMSIAGGAPSPDSQIVGDRI